MNADGFSVLDELETATGERLATLKERIRVCARFAAAQREAEEGALRRFCDTAVKPQPQDDKNKPDIFGILAYLMRRLLLRRS